MKAGIQSALQVHRKHTYRRTQFIWTHNIKSQSTYKYGVWFPGVPDQFCECVPVGAVSGRAQADGEPAGGVQRSAQRLPPHHHGAEHEPSDLVCPISTLTSACRQVLHCLTEAVLMNAIVGNV